MHLEPRCAKLVATNERNRLLSENERNTPEVSHENLDRVLQVIGFHAANHINSSTDENDPLHEESQEAVVGIIRVIESAGIQMDAHGTAITAGLLASVLAQSVVFQDDTE